MVQRTVLKVDISCQKCKKQLLKAVTALQGIDKIELDPTKSTLTVTGDADPYQIILRTRKTRKPIEVVSIGPPPPPPKDGGGQKKPDDKKPQDPKKQEQKPQTPTYYGHQSCPVCERMVFGIRIKDETYPPCSIL